MRYFASILTALLVSACATQETINTIEEPTEKTVSIETPKLSQSELDAQLTDHYTTGWAVTAGWPGEYPAGFSILKKDVVLKAHSRMHPLTPSHIDCPVPNLATYQQWNVARVEADDLIFKTATKIFKITITEDTDIEYPSDEMGYQVKKLSLKRGDQLSYLRYLGEGFTIVEFNGKEYEINENDLYNVSDISNQQDGGEDLWLELSCSDDKRAWVLYDEVIRQDGVGPNPITGYGESSDIAQSDIQGIIRQMELNAQHEAY